MTSSWLLTLPIGIPLFTLAVCALCWRSTALQRWINLAGSLALLAAAVALVGATRGGEILATQFGHWAPPFGITFVADMLAAAMVLITAIMAVAVSVYGFAPGESGPRHAFYHPLLQGLLLGVIGAFLTGDIFNMYVWFEIMLISSFGLLAVDATREQLDAGVKYVALNLIMTTVFLIAIGFLYGATGTLNMADLARVLPEHGNPGLVMTLAVMFLIAFGSKAALFPLFFWLPASYHTANTPVLAIFAALLTKVGVYAILRCFTLLFPVEGTFLVPVIGVIAALTMVTGVLGAAAHFDIRRILSFHIISQIGYMLVGVMIATPLALAGAVLYVIHHIIVKANLFLIGGAIARVGGSYDLKRIGGLQRKAPLLALLFAVPALSLAGLPPLSGFWAKFLVIKPSLDTGQVAMAVVALAVGVLTLFSMVKIWNEAFWKPAPDAALAQTAERRVAGAMLLPIAALALITLTIGLYPEPFVTYAELAADQLLHPATYVEAVTSAYVLPGETP
ncbi:Na+/H+ antiporter subunit D [Verticiella sediminum]|uniref:Na+/H+ antiporter subunit D n=1 Tax=Verticiella sediminum TaxID=1247510 RepID=A0A556AKN7_9BURK|nr:Na+/H+ antiporter subunit D [Verticiella sediminum]TSH93449.1 Na+/H+ antiporter subunit D [Verticiella sediminum]